MTPNEELLCKALIPVIEGVNFLADLIAMEDKESAGVDLLDRIGSGIEAGLIELKVDPSLFTDDGRLLWPSRDAGIDKGV
jgi:hypothetical protein